MASNFRLEVVPAVLKVCMRHKVHAANSVLKKHCVGLHHNMFLLPENQLTAVTIQLW